MKRCFKCGETKPLDDFYRHPMMADGHLGKCKACTKADVHSHYVAHRDEAAEYDRKRNSRPERRRARVAAVRKMRVLHPEKYAARAAVAMALHKGLLFRKPCEVCGEAKVQAHHTDYGRPLDVTWLCHKHHQEAHGKQTRAA